MATRARQVTRGRSNRRGWLVLAAGSVAIILGIAGLLATHADTKSRGFSPWHGRSATSAPVPTPLPRRPTPLPALTSLADLPGTDLRPTGVPLLRPDWRIVADYAANGGHSNTGAVDFGFTSDALGSIVVATHAGKVALLRGDSRYGNLVYIKGPDYTTTYGHLQTILVAEGILVRRGTQIGTVGRTGQAAQPQLDYQVWRAGDNRNPMDYCQCAPAPATTP